MFHLKITGKEAFISLLYNITRLLHFSTGLSKKTFKRLWLIQNSGAQLLTRTKKGEHISPVLVLYLLSAACLLEVPSNS